jgi:hypothetical protein
MRLGREFLSIYDGFRDLLLGTTRNSFSNGVLPEAVLLAEVK